MIWHQSHLNCIFLSLTHHLSHFLGCHLGYHIFLDHGFLCGYIVFLQLCCFALDKCTSCTIAYCNWFLHHNLLDFIFNSSKSLKGLSKLINPSTHLLITLSCFLSGRSGILLIRNSWLPNYYTLLDFSLHLHGLKLDSSKPQKVWGSIFTLPRSVSIFSF